VNWKTDLKLADLDAETAIEIVCKRCGLSRYETQAQLMERPGFTRAYLDEVEYSLHCSNRFCRGGVRISLIHDDKNEGFVGGMA
jgi:ribosomal protein L37E